MKTHRAVKNPTRTSPPKKGYMQKKMQKNLKQISAGSKRKPNSRGK